MKYQKYPIFTYFWGFLSFLALEPDLASYGHFSGPFWPKMPRKWPKNDQFSHCQVWHIKTGLFLPLNNLMPFVRTNFDFLVPLLATSAQKSGQNCGQTAQKILSVSYIHVWYVKSHHFQAQIRLTYSILLKCTLAHSKPNISTWQDKPNLYLPLHCCTFLFICVH